MENSSTAGSNPGDYQTPPFEYHGIPEVETLLETPLDVDNFATLQKQLAAAEAWLGRVSFQYRNSAAVLVQLRRQYLRPKDQERKLTDMDRTIALEADTREQQVKVDLLKDQAEILRNRISLGQSLLSSQREELKRQLR